MHQAWTNPKTLSIVSKLAGIDLVPVFDYEIGNINVSVNDQGTAKKTSDNDSDDVPVTKWHYDSYPFVCIVMMSDTSNMVGGETAVKTGSGQVMKVRGPQMVGPLFRLASRASPNQLSGLRHRHAGKAYFSPGSGSSRWRREDHDGDRVSASRPFGLPHLRFDHDTADLGPVRDVLPVDEVSCRSPATSTPGHAEGA